ncbi:SDR family oxidoreductase [Alloalcanivorax gelatiniphagus]
MDLSGAVAVITGGASGIGRATKDRLAELGARAVAWDLSGGDVVCDVTDVVSVENAMAETLEKFGVPTVLVTSAGIARMGTVVDLDVADWDLSYAVNIRGTMLALRVVARELLARGLPGSAVLVSSVNATLSDPGHSMYSTTKAAVSHLARCAAVEMGPAGIRVNAIAPGPIETPMLDGVLAIAGYREKVSATTPLGRIGQPSDIAEAISHVIQSDWITGQVITADGGTSLVSARGASRAQGLSEGTKSSS